MPSLNLDPDFPTNPKILRLCSRLGLGDAGYIIPIRLWSYAAKHHPETGTFVGYSVDEMERIVGWHGKRGQCLEALLAVKLLEIRRGGYRPKHDVSRGARSSNNGLHKRASIPHRKRIDSYTIHDWLEHAGHIIHYKQRAKSAAVERWKNERLELKPDATSNATSMPQAMPVQGSAGQGSSGQGSAVQKEKNPDSSSFSEADSDADKKDWAEQAQRKNRITRKMVDPFIEKFPKLKQQETSNSADTETIDEHTQ